MRSVFLAVFCAIIALVFLPAFGVANAAVLNFDKTTTSVNSGETFSVDVKVDPGAEQITSSDIYVIFDNTVLSAEGVDVDTYFPTVLSDIAAGRVYVAALVDEPTSFKTGIGTIASIRFKALKAGSTTLTFRCSSTVLDTSKIIKNDTSATDIIDCGGNGELAVTVGNGGSTTTNPVPTTIVSLPTTGGLGGGSTTTSSATLSARPTELPESGVFENVVRVVVPGVSFLVFGVFLKMYLRV